MPGQQSPGRDGKQRQLGTVYGLSPDIPIQSPRGEGVNEDFWRYLTFFFPSQFLHFMSWGPAEGQQTEWYSCTVQ